jgi:hypothetical protein
LRHPGWVAEFCGTSCNSAGDCGTNCGQEEQGRRRWRQGWSPRCGSRPSRASISYYPEELPLSRRFAHERHRGGGHVIRRIQRGNQGSVLILGGLACLDSLTLSCSEISGLCIKVFSCGLLEGEDGVFTL